MNGLGQLKADSILQGHTAKPTMMIRKLCLLALLPAYAMAADPVPAPSSGSLLTRTEAEAQVKHADELRKDAKLRQDKAEAIRLHDYNACLDKVLVNACRDDVRQAFIKTMDGIRKQEIEANQLNREAKARLNELNDAERQAPKPSGKPAGNQDGTAPKALPKPHGKPSGAPAQAQSGPSPTVSPAAQARADAEKARKRQTAEQQRAANASAASKRAEQAAKDREKYERRQQEHAEKMAKRANSSAKKATASAPAGK